MVIDEIAIEVKASENVDDRDMKGLRALKEERLLKNCIVVSREKHIRKVGGITILPWCDFITARNTACHRTPKKSLYFFDRVTG